MYYYLRTVSLLLFSVQILNERNEIFTIEDDPYMGLSVLSCVREEENEGGKQAVIQVREIYHAQQQNEPSNTIIILIL